MRLIWPSPSSSSHHQRKVVASTVDRVLETLDRRGVPEVHLQPSNGLEFLPRDRALRKLERMREIRDAVTKAAS